MDDETAAGRIRALTVHSDGATKKRSPPLVLKYQRRVKGSLASRDERCLWCGSSAALASRARADIAVTIAVPAAHYFVVLETAAAHLGLVGARFLERTGWLVHDDLLSGMLREACRLDERYVPLVFNAYASALSAECGALELLAPIRSSVIQVLRDGMSRGQPMHELDIKVLSSISVTV